MKYEQQILEAYDRLGFKPRDHQVEHIDTILVAFLDEKFTNVILSAPTGTGKSIIGAVVADVVHQIRMPNNKPGASFMLTATNVLAKQYQDSFGDPDNPWEGTFLQIKGASNYKCEALDTPEEPARADSCTIIAFQKAGMQDMIEKYCGRCEYKLSRALREKSRHLITNYSYYFINRMYATHPMESRSVCVFDEAHLLNDLFVEHNAIYFSEKRLNSFAEEIAEALGVGNHDIYLTFKKIREDLVRGAITDDNYEEHLQSLMDVYKSVSDSLKAKAESNLRNPSKYVKLSRMSKKYQDLGCKIDDYFIFDYPSVFEYRAKDIKKGNNEHEVSVKPIFIGEMFAALHNAQHNLLMSATISESYVKRTMTLPGTTKYIRLPPQFPVENKKVVFFKPQLLNYNTMKDPAVVKRLADTTTEIVRHHSALDERGVILAPSFVVAQALGSALEKARIKGLQVFEHQRGEKLADVLFDFKRAKGTSVLITPSGFEGIDLPGDLSRYQVIVKAPFASLGDRRIEHIANIYPDIYSLMALMKIVQGAGRSVRSKEDHATTYMLDTAIQRLWTKGNAWEDEFKTRFTSTLAEEV